MNRFPKFRDIIPVYALVAFLIQVWTITVFIWQLPSFSSFLSIPEVLAVFAYRIAGSFLECLLVAGMLVVAAVILPSTSFRDVFVVRGAAFATVLLGSMIVFWQRFATEPGVLMADYIQWWTLGTLFFACLLSYASTRSKALRDFFDWMSDRMIVFLYILFPVSVVSLIVVFIRNMI